MAGNIYKKRRFNRPNLVYWFLLLYIIAALAWWFIALNIQNRQMTEYKLSLLTHDDISYIPKAEKIYTDRDRKTAQYIGEGLFILIVILVGAIFLYTAIRRQNRIHRQQQNFMMAITHELKTPISIARLNLETLLKHALNDAQKEKLLKSSLQEINRLNTLTGNILVSAQLEGGSYRFDKESLDMSKIVGDSCQDFIARFPGRPWHTEIANGIYFTGDPLLIQILVNNLIENAVKYSAPDAPVYISLKNQNNKGLLEVKDEGVGISQKERKRIFQKFYRVGNEDTRSTQGTGLGLYLCSKIARDHKMVISMVSNQPQGSIFTVHFNMTPS
ncbi:MAG: ATP-binding protein [Bacteroidota bacterium]|nr:ATP-binding protein [Bacteroidota bacterium]MDP4212793.1 ATP-binding protein [Bacteroidota bacterium]MDP4250231.1 ATP-binding protein [Bacteroidota bacterium]